MTTYNERQYRRFKNTIKDAEKVIPKVNQYLIPSLGVASAIAPEFAPLFGTIGTIAKGTEKATSELANFV